MSTRIGRVPGEHVARTLGTHTHTHTHTDSHSHTHTHTHTVARPPVRDVSGTPLLPWSTAKHGAGKTVANLYVRGRGGRLRSERGVRRMMLIRSLTTRMPKCLARMAAKFMKESCIPLIVRTLPTPSFYVKGILTKTSDRWRMASDRWRMTSGGAARRSQASLTAFANALGILSHTCTCIHIHTHKQTHTHNQTHMHTHPHTHAQAITLTHTLQW